MTEPQLQGSERCLVDLTGDVAVSTVLDMDIEAALKSKGMDETQAGILAFDLNNATSFVELAENGLRDAQERRERHIRNAAAAGLTYRQIAEAVELSYQRIAQIVQGDPPRRRKVSSLETTKAYLEGIGLGEDSDAMKALQDEYRKRQQR